MATEDKSNDAMQCAPTHNVFHTFPAARQGHANSRAWQQAAMANVSVAAFPRAWAHMPQSAPATAPTSRKTSSGTRRDCKRGIAMTDCFASVEPDPKRARVPPGAADGGAPPTRHGAPRTSTATLIARPATMLDAGLMAQEGGEHGMDDHGDDGDSDDTAIELDTSAASLPPAAAMPMAPAGMVVLAPAPRMHATDLLRNVLQGLQLNWFTEAGTLGVQQATTSLFVDPQMLAQVTDLLRREHGHAGCGGNAGLHGDDSNNGAGTRTVQTGHFFTGVGQRVEFKVTADAEHTPRAAAARGQHADGMDTHVPAASHGSCAPGYGQPTPSARKVKVDIQFTRTPPLALEWRPEGNPGAALPLHSSMHVTDGGTGAGAGVRTGTLQHLPPAAANMGAGAGSKASGRRGAHTPSGMDGAPGHTVSGSAPAATAAPVHSTPMAISASIASSVCHAHAHAAGAGAAAAATGQPGVGVGPRAQIPMQATATGVAAALRAARGKRPREQPAGAGASLASRSAIQLPGVGMHARLGKRRRY